MERSGRELGVFMVKGIDVDLPLCLCDSVAKIKSKELP
jgi:hypothetical protein